jgi:hypothetical protein
VVGLAGLVVRRVRPVVSPSLPVVGGRLVRRPARLVVSRRS